MLHNGAFFHMSGNRPKIAETGDEKRATLDVVVPVYNESAGVVHDTVGALLDCLAPWGDFRIIIVDDGSDAPPVTAHECWGPRVTVVRHEKNRGYGRALKTGIEEGSAPLIAIIDADGSYPASDMLRLLSKMPGNDMVVGTRNGRVVEEFPFRAFLKRGLNLAATVLTAERIVDLNSGMRIFKRSLCEKFWPHYPEGFSFTSTITMGAVCGGHRVACVPINYYRRVGQSSVKLVEDSILMAVKLMRLTWIFRFGKGRKVCLRPRPEKPPRFP